MVGMEKDLSLSILGAAVKLKESRLEMFVGRIVKSKKWTVMTGTQGYPTNTPTELHLVEVGENVD